MKVTTQSQHKRNRCNKKYASGNGYVGLHKRTTMKCPHTIQLNNTARGCTRNRAETHVREKHRIGTLLSDCLKLRPRNVGSVNRRSFLSSVKQFRSSLVWSRKAESFSALVSERRETEHQHRNAPQCRETARTCATTFGCTWTEEGGPTQVTTSVGVALSPTETGASSSGRR